MSRDLVISVKIPARLAELIDFEIRRLGFQNRSEFIRDAIRKALNENDENENNTFLQENENKQKT